jgi:hypothetical protein
MAETLTLELWKPAAGLLGYEVSDMGRVRSARGIRALGGNGKGYVMFRTTTRNINLSRLILKTFVGDAPAGMHACHGDGDKSNNRLTNLRWDTPKGNQADNVPNGTHHRGERHPQAKLSNAQVQQILVDVRMHKEIAASYGVSRSHISSIKCGSFRRYG